MASGIGITYRIVVSIGKLIVSQKIVIQLAISVDEPTPAGVIIPALEVIQPGLLWLCIAARAKLSEAEMEKTGAKSASF